MRPAGLTQQNATDATSLADRASMLMYCVQGFSLGYLALATLCAIILVCLYSSSPVPTAITRKGQAKSKPGLWSMMNAAADVGRLYGNAKRDHSE